MLARRLIPCLDVRDGQVVKGVQFRDHRVVGEILELARRYRDEGADELVFYDITASPQGRSVDRSWISRVAEVLDIPFCVAGGIRSVADAEAILNAGAEKISVNSPALLDPDLINRLAARFGSQCVVVGIDSQTTPEGFRVYQFTGDPDRSRDSGRDTLQWVREAQQRGAGEIVLNCMASDGVRRGYDLEQLSAVRAVCNVPLVASGGAGAPEHFAALFGPHAVDAALAASVFHSGQIAIPELKRYLRARHIEVRHEPDYRHRIPGLEEIRRPAAGHRPGRRQRAVLMLGYMNPRRCADAAARPRRVLQPHACRALGKGRDLGPHAGLVSVAIDCDRDALLVARGRAAPPATCRPRAASATARCRAPMAWDSWRSSRR
ncbi:MAG: imidazole glycerol phosphate synthase subunit HisF [Proteobacteria bacterium]|nr:imidazole glycerol phosphate synthase subunit HisF [Pseudomonadota bacterium]